MGGPRRHLHAHPELSFQEHETMAFVSKQLTAWGGTPNPRHRHRHRGPRERNGSRVASAALRADMDALPIQEANDAVCVHATGGHARMWTRRAHHLMAGHGAMHFSSLEKSSSLGRQGHGGGRRAGQPRTCPRANMYPQLPAGHVGVRGGAYGLRRRNSLDRAWPRGHAALPHLQGRGPRHLRDHCGRPTSHFQKVPSECGLGALVWARGSLGRHERAPSQRRHPRHLPIHG